MMLSGMAVVMTIIFMASDDEGLEDISNNNSSNGRNSFRHNDTSNSHVTNGVTSFTSASTELVNDLRQLHSNHSSINNSIRAGSNPNGRHYHGRNSSFRRSNNISFIDGLSQPKYSVANSEIRLSPSSNHNSYSVQSTNVDGTGWRGDANQSVFLQNGLYNEAMDVHPEYPNDAFRGAMDIDSGFHNQTNSTNHLRRRHSARTVGSFLDRVSPSNKHSSHKSGCGNIIKYVYSRFLIRIPKRDKYLYLTFFSIWLLLTTGFVVWTVALKSDDE